MNAEILAQSLGLVGKTEPSPVNLPEDGSEANIFIQDKEDLGTEDELIQ